MDSLEWLLESKESLCSMELVKRNTEVKAAQLKFIHIRKYAYVLKKKFFVAERRYIFFLTQYRENFLMACS